MTPDRRETLRPLAAPPDPLAGDADEAIRQILRLLYLLPAPSLSSREHNRLTSFLVPDATHLCYAVVHALQGFGPELPEVAEDPADLLALQERADRLLELRGHLDALRQRADEAHLRAQSLAVRRARAVLQRLDHGARLLPTGSSEQRLRRALIGGAAPFDPRFALSTLPEDL